MKNAFRLIPILCVGLFFSHLATSEDLLDVEVGMEDVMQESTAAQLEAEASLEREQRKEAELEEAIQKAENAKAKAKMKEREAKQQIAASHKSIQEMNKKIADAEAKTQESEKQYQKHVADMEKKQKELEQVKVQLQEKQDLLQEQRHQTQQALQQLRDTERKILAEKDRVQSAHKELEAAKKEKAEVEKKLTKATERLTRQKLDTQKQLEVLGAGTQKLKNQTQNLRAKATGASRGPASVSPRWIRASLKSNCSAHSGPTPSSPSVWSGKKGDKVLGVAHSSTWVKMKMPSGDLAYIARSCF